MWKNYHPTKITYPNYNQSFQKICKEFNITLAVQNKFNNKTAIKTKNKERQQIIVNLILIV